MSNWSPPPIWPQTPRRRQGIWNYPRPHRTGLRAWIPSWRFVVGALLTGTSLVAGVVMAAWVNVTVPEELGTVRSETTTVYYSDGKVLGTFAEQNRTIISLDDLPPQVTDAIVSSEDQSFRSHPGINPQAIVRAVLNNVTGGAQQGASTLTQQYVENYYVGVGDTTYVDEFREAILALKVTQQQSKDQVLEGYINTIYLGRGAYGVEAASQAYFGHSAKKMTISESAFLAGIIPNPTYWDPRQGEAAEAQAKARWERTLNLMVEQGNITEEDRAAAEYPKVIEYKQGSGNNRTAYLLEAVARELADPDGADISEDALTRNGYTIKTTLDSRLQKAATDAMTLPEDADPRIRASLTSIDPSSGAIRALYGGPDYSKYKTNAATQDIAQAGSTFKPFTLVAALEEDIPLTKTYDGTSPQEIEGYTTWNAETGEEEQAPLTNFGPLPYGESYPNVSLLDATAYSVNTAYVHLNKEVGPDRTRDVALRAGIPQTNSGGDEIVAANLANVLGTASVRNIDIAHAYSTFAAQGSRTTPHLVDEVRNGDNLTHEWSGIPTEEFDSEVMAAATYAMTQVVEKGSGEPASELTGPNGEKRPVAGKTGTSNSNKSAWFAGYVPQLATVVGLYQYDLEARDGKGEYMQIAPFGEWKDMGVTGMTGGSWPVTAWADYMAKATEGMDVAEFPEYTPPAPPEPTQSPSPSPSTSPSEEPEEEKVEVPTGLVGKQYTAAASALAGVELIPHQVDVDSDQPAGIVLSVDREGQEVNRGDTIRVEVSNGSQVEQETTTVPWGLTNQDRGYAEEQVRAAELTPVVQEASSDSVAEGRVISVDPSEGSEVPKGSQVTLVVSTGPEEGGGDPTGDPTGGGDGDGDGGGIFG